MAPFLNLEPGNLVLDAGCGLGNGFPILSDSFSKSLKYFMVDISDDFVNKAKSVYGEKAEIKRANAESLPFKPNTFDAYIANGLLEIVDNPD